MNLALKDIRFNLLRFLMTIFGVGFLVTASIGMIGLYRGIVADALLVIDGIGADLWIVQGGRDGPFAEASSVSSTMDRRVAGVAGIGSVRRFVQYSQQFSANGKALRAAITGLDFPDDKGDWLRYSAGRPLSSAHYEIVADESTGLLLGQTVRLGRDDYHVVGLTHGMVDASGDGLLFVTVADAMDIAAERTSEEILLSRAANAGAVTTADDPLRKDGKIAAVMASLQPNADIEAVRKAIRGWGDVNVLSRAEQRDLLLNQRLWRLRVQILAFTAVLLVVMALVISMIIYTLTIEKLHQIAMLKLIGARNRVIVSMIADQAFAIGIGGFAFGLGMAHVIFPAFPRTVVMAPADLALLFAVVAVICGSAGLFGISRAMKVRAQEVLS